MTNILTKADIQAYAPELDLSGYDDTTISGMLTRAQQLAVDYCEVSGFDSQTVIAETDHAHVNSDGDLVISTLRRPIQSVSAIRLKGTNVNVNLGLTDSADNPYYFIPAPGTMVYYPSNFLVSAGVGLIGLRSARLYYEIDYEGGYTEPPSSLKEAITLYFRDITATRTNQSGAMSWSQGSMSMSFGAQGQKSKLVLQAEEILSKGSYHRRVI